MVNDDFKRSLYPNARPNTLARILNRFWAIVHALGVMPNYLVTLEVQGRRTGRTISFPLVMVAQDGERYLVAMFGDKTGWARNVIAANGQATLRHGRTEPIRLEEIPVSQRARVLKRYLQIAPGARPHIPISKDDPLEVFEAHAAEYPVFRVVARDQG